MDIEFLRSSSMNTWASYCQMKYFLVYCLGLNDPSNIKTEVGTVVHAVLEILAGLKQYIQNNPKEVYCEFKHAQVGEFKYNAKELYQVTTLKLDEITKINRSRKNKDTYRDQKYLDVNATRMGRNVVNDIISKCYDYYSSNSVHEWTNIQKRDCANFTWMALEWLDGEFDPRNRKIIYPEYPFQIEIKKPWAKLDNGEYFKIKGTIDLVTDAGDSTIEIVDWKGLPTYTCLPTPTGLTTMGMVKVGDILYDKYGNETKVIAKSEASYKDCYSITFDDESSIICDHEHVWNLANEENKAVIDLNIGDEISLTRPIQYPEKKLIIDPYLLGIWIACGKFNDLKTNNRDIYYKLQRKNIDFIETNIGIRVTELNKFLSKYKLDKKKIIPQDFLLSSVSQRREILQGFCDARATVDNNRIVHKKQTNLEDIKTLLLSLGQKVYTDNSFTPCYINPFSIRKKRREVENIIENHPVRKIVKIEKLTNQLKTQCISVDSPSKTYLCGLDNIPTHNTGLRYDWGKAKVKEYDDLMEDTQLLLYYYAARKSFPQFDNIMFTIFFIRDGGPYTLGFDDSSLEKMEHTLETLFKEIKACNRPKLLDITHQDFRCNKLCGFYKNKTNGKSQCDHISNEIDLYGIEKATKRNRAEGFQVGFYKDPGAVE